MTGAEWLAVLSLGVAFVSVCVAAWARFATHEDAGESNRIAEYKNLQEDLRLSREESATLRGRLTISEAKVEDLEKEVGRLARRLTRAEDELDQHRRTVARGGATP